MPESRPVTDPELRAPEAEQDRPHASGWLRRVVLGAPRSLSDRRIFHKLSLIPFLAWVGLGADGLSSSAYGPEAAFHALGQHTYLAVLLAVATAGTVFLISAAYSRIIEEFPHGGGGYVVATKCLGERAGVVSGCALLVDYVLTITTSIAAAGDALFSFLPISHDWKLWVEAGLIGFLIWINIRGVKESVVTLVPIFLVFVVTHLVVIVGGILAHVPEVPETAERVAGGFSQGIGLLGAGGLAMLLLRAYSLGGGTYTGIEAVSNGLPIMREPRAQTAKRTMIYMAVSLAFTAAGLLVCYLLWDVRAKPGMTMNAVLVESMTKGIPGGWVFALVTLLSEGALLVVAAQAGFLDGPRVLANMAIDSWMPHRFAALSERLTTHNGIFLMGLTSLAALLLTGGSVEALLIMYSINVFLTFSLSTFGMALLVVRTRRSRQHWKRRLTLFVSGFLLCFAILAVTVHEKFTEGGWITLIVTGSVVALCFVIRAHYDVVGARIEKLYRELGELPRAKDAPAKAPDAHDPLAVVLVSSYSGLGIHTVLNIFRTFPGHYKGLLFASIGILDSGTFKGDDTVDALKAKTEETLKKYAELARGLGVPAVYRYAIGTDVVDEAEKLCLEIARDFPRSTFFAGKIIFERERWYQRLLHNETPFAIQKRLHWAGATMAILPARVT